jgi:hypothetical protein
VDETPTSRPWYQRWWVWTIYGASLATTAVAIVAAILATQSSPSTADTFCDSGGGDGCVPVMLSP